MFSISIEIWNIYTFFLLVNCYIFLSTWKTNSQTLKLLVYRFTHFLFKQGNLIILLTYVQIYLARQRLIQLWCDVILHLIALMESHYIHSDSLAEAQSSDWRRGARRRGHVQSLLSGYKRINILLNPECLPGQLNLTLSIHCSVSLLSLSRFLSPSLCPSNSLSFLSRRVRWIDWRLMCWLAEGEGDVLKDSCMWVCLRGQRLDR